MGEDLVPRYVERAREFLHRRTGVLLPVGHARGLTVGRELRRELRCDFRTVFDVGAHHGESAVEMMRWYPRATVHAFEPTAESVQIIRRKFAGQPRLHVHHLALGEHERTTTLHLRAESLNNSLHDYTVVHPAERCVGIEQVHVVPLDTWCADHDVDRIDFLKVDTEGHDLAVLRGAVRLLSEHRIVALQVEAGINVENVKHVPLPKLVELLEGFDYRLFGFYDQMWEWTLNRPYLRRVNAVFMSTSSSV